jgi:hypothetical protein
LAQLNELQPKLEAMCSALENVTVDTNFIESSLMAPRSGVSELILNMWSKERAIEDLMLGLREKSLPLPEMLKVMRQLSKKQFKIQNKIKKLYAYHQSNS